MKVVTGLWPATVGRVRVASKAVAGPLNCVGMAFQNSSLLPWRTILQNVMLPLELAGDPEANRKAREMLDRVGLRERLRHYPKYLSGGEQQRVALARAFVMRPKLLLADEPTANLDDGAAVKVVDLLSEQAARHGATLVVATHDARVKGKFRERLAL